MNIEITHRGFYLENEPFYPTVKERIVLPAGALSDLDWKKEYLKAQQLAAQNEWLFFDLEFGLESGPLFLQDSALFFSRTLAIEQFIKVFWGEFKDKIVGVSFYRGKFDFADRMMVDGEDNSRLPLFCGRLFAEYLHRLASFLPDQLAAFCLFDLSEIKNKAEQALFLSKERFEHVHFAIKGTSLNLGLFSWDGQQLTSSTLALPALGICLPSDEYCSQEVIAILDRLVSDLENQKMPFRLIPEAFLTEQWDGLDNIIVIKQALGPQGKRKLLGFAAAGGRVIIEGEPIGIFEEISVGMFLQEK